MSAGRRAGAPAGAARGPAARRPPARREALAAPAPRLDLRALASHPVFLATLAGFLLYLPSFGYQFVWDDHRLIEINPAIRSIEGLAKLMVSDFWVSTGKDASGFWRPVIVFSYWVDGVLSGWKPWLFRAENALWHGAVAGLTVALALQQGLPRVLALLAGLWFAAMPAHLESVAWISGRTDVYSAAFFLLTLWLDRRDRKRKRRTPGLLALGSLALALLAKEASAPFLAVVALAEFVGTRDAKGRWDWKASARWIAPYVAITAIYLVVHLLLVRTPPPPVYLSPEVQRRGRWSVWLMFPGYLKFLWPYFPHSPATVLPLPRSPWTPAVVGAALLQIGFVAAIVALALKRSRAALPLGLFWVILLPPTIGMVTNAYLLFSERFVYTPSAGIAWALAAGLAALGARPLWRRVAVALTVALVVTSAIETLRSLPTWASDEAQFHAMTVRQPTNFMGHVTYARWLAGHGRDAEARASIARAAALDERRPEVYSVRAILDFRRGAFDSAVRNADQALRLDRVLLEPRLLKTTALLHLGRLDEADSLLLGLLAETPDNPPVWSLWGQSLVMRGRFAEALPYLERAAQWQKDDLDLEWARGVASARLDRVPEARAAFQRTVEIDPTYYDGWLKLATACHLLGDLEGRDRALARAAALPEAADGRAEKLRARLRSGAP